MTSIRPDPSGPEGEALIIARRDLRIERGGKCRRSVAARRGARGRSAAAARRVARPADPVARHHRYHPVLGAWLQVTVGLRPLQQLQGAAGRHPHREGAAAFGQLSGRGGPLVGEFNDVLDLREPRWNAPGGAQAIWRMGSRRRSPSSPPSPATCARTAAAPGRRHRGAGGRDAAPCGARPGAGQALERQGAMRQPRSAAVAERVAAAMARLPGAEDLDFDIACAAEATVPIEQGDLTELLGNLLDNARKWAQNHACRLRYAAPLLVIEDDGPGVAEEELDAHFRARAEAGRDRSRARAWASRSSRTLPISMASPSPMAARSWAAQGRNPRLTCFPARFCLYLPCSSRLACKGHAMAAF